MPPQRDEQLDRIERKVDSLGVLLRGPEDEPELGAIFRIAELEKAERARQRTRDALVNLAVTCIATNILTLVGGIAWAVTHAR